MIQNINRLKKLTIHVVGAAIVREIQGSRDHQIAECLIARRGPQVTHAGQWEFPGGKVEPGEAPGEALRRELREELAIDVEVGVFLGRGEAELPGRRIELDVYCCDWQAGELRLSDHDQVRWIKARDIDTLNWAEADRPILPALRAALTLHPDSQR